MAARYGRIFGSVLVTGFCFAISVSVLTRGQDLGDAISLAPTNVAAILSGDANSEIPPILSFECSVFLLDSRTAITARHCVDGSSTVIVASGSDNLCDSGSWRRTEAEVGDGIDGVDLVSLTALSGSTWGGSSAVDRATTVSDELLVHGWQQTRRTGPVQCELATSSLHDCRFDAQEIVCDISSDDEVCGGLSGAGALDGAGNVVGVVSSSVGCAGGEARIAPVDTLRSGPLTSDN